MLKKNSQCFLLLHISRYSEKNQYLLWNICLNFNWNFWSFLSEYIILFSLTISKRFLLPIIDILNGSRTHSIFSVDFWLKQKKKKINYCYAQSTPVKNYRHKHSIYSYLLSYKKNWYIFFFIKKHYWNYFNIQVDLFVFYCENC